MPSSAAVLKKSSLSSVFHLGRGTSWGSWPSWSIGLSGSWRTSCPGTTRTCLQRGRQCSGRALNYDKHSVFGEKDSVTNCEPTILRILIGDLEILQLFFGPPPVNWLLHQVVNHHISDFFVRELKIRRSEILRNYHPEGWGLETSFGCHY